jgi:hypothetical protein
MEGFLIQFASDKSMEFRMRRVQDTKLGCFALMKGFARDISQLAL